MRERPQEMLVGTGSRALKITLVLLVVAFGLMEGLCAADSPRTPEPGSAERRAICDGAREFVLREYVAPTKLPKPLVFEVRRMEVLGNYCCFEAFPQFKDGSPIGTQYIADIQFLFLLQRTHGKWRVINDLSRTDVPTDLELKRIRTAIPKDFPFELIPKFWRDISIM